ncbi:sugar transferase [Bacteroides sp. KG122]|uniref:sugar transferase n=2 Tax=Bacteroides TaxID=816 RepID=UPI003D992AC7
MYRHFFKRLIACTLSILGLIVCCIPMIIIAIAIKLDSKGPVFFRQDRLGKDMKTFRIFKFRTMVVGAYEMGGKATRSDDARITKVGAFLRRTSLDELPQMFNILRGGMTIIGPRPILPVEWEPYKDNTRYAKRYEVRQAMFGTVDVINRAADRDLQFSMDADYVENLTFWLDVKTFFQIISVVISGKNVYMEEVDEKNKK